VLKNNRDAAGHSFGCHENYLVRPETAAELDPGLAAFLATRPLLTGGGALVTDPDGTRRWTFSARAPMILRVLSPDPTRERPMVLTRAEPHADASRHARLQVTHGDSNVTDTTTALKLGLTVAVLDLLEAADRSRTSPWGTPSPRSTRGAGGGGRRRRPSRTGAG
jgi:proteasome accessory factor A